MDNTGGVGLLKGRSSYANPYEGAYQRLSKDVNFNAQTWLDAIKNGQADTYLSLLEQNKGKLLSTNFYNDNYYNFERQMLELYRNVADNTDTENAEERFKTVYDYKSGEYVQESIGKMTDQAYIDYQLNQIDEERTAEITRIMEQWRKDEMNWLQKVGATTLSAGAELGEGAVSGVTTVFDTLFGFTYGLGAAWSDGSGGNTFADSYMEYMTKGLTAKEKESFRYALDEYERKFTYMKDIDGNTTGVGKYLGGITNSIGMMAPSAVLAIVTGGASIVGELTYASAFFALGIAGNNLYENATNPDLIDTPSALKVGNAFVKAGIETAIELSLAKFLGATTGDMITKGMFSDATKLKNSLGAMITNGGNKQALFKIFKDGVQEGTEEFLQDFSTNLVDLGCSLYYEGYGNTGVNIQTLTDSFIIGMVTSFVLTGAHIGGGEAISKLEKTEFGSKIVDSHNANVELRALLGESKRTDRLWGQSVGLETEGKYKELTGLSKWYYKQILNDFQSNINKLKEDGLAGVSKEKAIELYGAMEILSQFYSSFEPERLAKASSLLERAFGEYKPVDAGAKTAAFDEFTKNLQESFHDMVGNSKKRIASINRAVELNKQKLEDAEVSKFIARYDDEDYVNDSELREEAKNLINKFLKSNTDVIVTDGHTAIEEDGVVIVSESWLNNYTESEIYSFLNNTHTIDYVLNLKEYKNMIDDMHKNYKEFSGNENASKEEALMNLLFNEKAATNFILSDDGVTVHEYANELFTILGVIKDHCNDSKWFNQKYGGKLSNKRMALAQKTYRAIAKNMRVPILKAINNWHFDVDTFGAGITDVLSDADFAEIKQSKVRRETKENIGSSAHKYLVDEYIDAIKENVAQEERSRAISRVKGADDSYLAYYTDKINNYKELLERLDIYKNNPHSLSKDELTETRAILDAIDFHNTSISINAKIRGEYKERKGWLDKAFTLSHHAFAGMSKADVQFISDAEHRVYNKITYGTNMFNVLGIEDDGDLQSIVTALYDDNKLNTFYKYLQDGKSNVLIDANGSMVRPENLVHHIGYLLQKELGDNFFVYEVYDYNENAKSYDHSKILTFNINIAVPAIDFMRPEVREELELDDIYASKNANILSFVKNIQSYKMDEAYRCVSNLLYEYNNASLEDKIGKNFTGTVDNYSYTLAGDYIKVKDLNSGDVSYLTDPDGRKVKITEDFGNINSQSTQAFYAALRDLTYCKLSDIFDLSSIKTLFDELDDVKVRLEQIDGEGGHFSRYHNEIVLNPNEPDLYDVLIHETQHAIQHHTFKPGGYHWDSFTQRIADNKYFEYIFFNYPLLVNMLVERFACNMNTGEMYGIGDVRELREKFEETKFAGEFGDEYVDDFENLLRLAGYYINQGEIEARAYTHNRAVTGMTVDKDYRYDFNLNGTVLKSKFDANSARVLENVYRQQDYDTNYKTVHTRATHVNTLLGNVDKTREVMKAVVSSKSPTPLGLLSIETIIKNPEMYLAQEVIDTLNGNFDEGNVYYRLKDYIENLGTGVSIDRTAKSHKYILVDDTAFNDLLSVDVKKHISKDSTKLLDKFNKEETLGLKNIFKTSELNVMGINPNIMITFNKNMSDSTTLSDGEYIDVEIGTKDITNDEKLIMEICHEFRHVVQFSHGFEAGFSTDYPISSDKVAEFEKHMPELFKNAPPDLKGQKDWKRKYVKHLIYVFTGGELNAFGVENKFLHTKPVYYDKIGDTVNVFLPWYNADTKEGMWTLKDTSKKKISKKVNPPASTLTKEELVTRIVKKMHADIINDELSRRPASFVKDYQALDKELKNLKTEKERTDFFNSLSEDVRNEVLAFEGNADRRAEEAKNKLMLLSEEELISNFGDAIKSKPVAVEPKKKEKKTSTSTTKKGTSDKTKKAAATKHAKDNAKARENAKVNAQERADRALAKMMLGTGNIIGQQDKDVFVIKGTKYKQNITGARYISKTEAENTNLKYYTDKGIDQLDVRVKNFVKNTELDKLDAVVKKSITEGTFGYHVAGRYIREAKKMNDYTFQMLNKYLFDDNKLFNTFEELNSACKNANKYYGYICTVNRYPKDFIKFINDNDMEGVIKFIDNSPKHKNYMERVKHLYTFVDGMDVSINDDKDKKSTNKSKKDAIDMIAYTRVQMLLHFRGDLKSIIGALYNTRRAFTEFVRYGEQVSKSLDEGTGGDNGEWHDKETSLIDNITDEEVVDTLSGTERRYVGNSILDAYNEEIKSLDTSDKLDVMVQYIAEKLYDIRLKEFARKVNQKYRDAFLEAANPASNRYKRLMNTAADSLTKEENFLKRGVLKFIETYYAEAQDLKILSPEEVYAKYSAYLDAELFGKRELSDDTKLAEIAERSGKKRSTERRKYLNRLKQVAGTIEKNLNNKSYSISDLPDDVQKFFGKNIYYVNKKKVIALLEKNAIELKQNEIKPFFDKMTRECNSPEDAVTFLKKSKWHIDITSTEAKTILDKKSNWHIKPEVYSVGRGRKKLNGGVSPYTGVKYLLKTDITDADLNKYQHDFSKVIENYEKLKAASAEMTQLKVKRRIAIENADKILKKVEGEKLKKEVKAATGKNVKTTVVGKGKKAKKGTTIKKGTGSTYNVVSSVDMPSVLKTMLDVSFDEQKDTLVQLISTEKNTGERLTKENKKGFESLHTHAKTSAKLFYEANAKELGNLSFKDATNIVKFFGRGAHILDDLVAEERLKVYEQYVLSYIYRVSYTGALGWKFDKEQFDQLEQILEIKRSGAGMVLNAVKDTLDQLNPFGIVLSKSLRNYGIDDIDSQSLIDKVNVMLHAKSTEETTKAVLELNEEIARIEKMMKYDEIANIDKEIADYEEAWKKEYDEAEDINDKTAMSRLNKERDEYLKEAEKRKKNVNTSTFWRKLKSLRVTNMLSSPTTWIRNIISNEAVDKLTIGSDVLAKALLSKKAYRKDQWDLSGVKVTDAVKKFVDEYVLNDKNNAVLERLYNTTTKYDDRVDRAGRIKDDIFITMLQESMKQKYAAENRFNNKQLQRWNDFIMNRISDRTFIKKATVKYFSKILTLEVNAGHVSLAKGMNNDILNLFAESLIQANEEYMHRTSFIGELIQSTRDTHPVFYEAMTLWQPFINSSINWYGEMIKYSPIGLASSIYKLAKLEKQIQLREERRAKGEIVADSRFTEYLARRDIGKGTIGTILLTLGMLLGFMGHIRIKDDDDKSYVYIGDTKFDISSIFGTSSLLIGASLAQTFDNSDNKSAVDIMEIIVGEFVEGFILNDLLERHKYDDSFFDLILVEGENFFKSFIPQILQFSVRTFNNEKIQYTAGFAGAWERFINSFMPTQPMGSRVTDIYTGETKSKYAHTMLGTVAASGLAAGIKIYFSPITEQEKFVRSYGVNKNQLTGELTANNKSYTLDKMALNKKYGELNSDIQILKTQKHYVQMDNGNYRTLSWDRLTDEQKARVIERTMRKNAEYAKIYVWVSSGHKYYADDETYKALRALGIKSNVYRGDKGYVE